MEAKPVELDHDRGGSGDEITRPEDGDSFPGIGPSDKV